MLNTRTSSSRISCVSCTSCSSVSCWRSAGPAIFASNSLIELSSSVALQHHPHQLGQAFARRAERQQVVARLAGQLLRSFAALCRTQKARIGQLASDGVLADALAGLIGR